METANMEIALGNHHWSQQHHTNSVVQPIPGKEMEYMALMKDPSLQPIWKRGFGNEVGGLFQGIRDIPATDTCFFVELTNIPKDRQITYGKIVCDYKPHEKEKERVRLTVGSDMLDYSGDVTTSTVDIVKLLPLPQPACARPHGRMDEPNRPESHPTKECACARVRCLNTEPNY
jgi:hypothetical protein